MMESTSSLSAFEELLMAGKMIDSEDTLGDAPDVLFCENVLARDSSTNSYLVTVIFVGLFVCSVTGLLFISVSILTSSKLQSHP